MIYIYLLRAGFLVLLFGLTEGLRSQSMTVQSTAFADTHYIPLRYTCDGDNINPGFRFKGIPSDARSLVLIMLDTSAVFGVFDHWLVWNIPPVKTIRENSTPGVIGRNSNSENKYMGPCPPNGMHEYHFRIYALNVILNLPSATDKPELLRAMTGHILATGELIGFYYRQ